MKKIVILMGIAAMAFASCAKDTVKETNNGRAIDFRVAAQTRASETTTANLTTFYVTAIDEQGSNYFTNAAFTKIEEYFSSSPVYYWPGSGSLNFFAYAPSATTLGATVTINNTTKTLAGFSPAAEITDQKDFVTASASGSKADETSGVALTFDHQLSQIEVKARNANEGYVYQIKGVRFAQPVAKADFDFATSEWTLSTDAADKAVYDVTYNNVVTLNTFAQNIMKSEGDNAMLIPQQLVAWDAENDQTNANKGAYLSVYAKVTTADGAKVYPKADGMEYAWLAVPVDTKWEAGYKYVYTLDFTSGAGYPDPLGGDPTGSTALGGPIKFTMDVNPWTEKATQEATKNMLIGSWEAVRIEETWFRADGTVEHNIYDDKAAVQNYLREMFWYIDIVSENEYVIFAGTEKEKVCGFQIIDNHLYVDEFYDASTGTYRSDMFIRDISEDISTFTETFYFDEDQRVNQYFYIRKK